MCKRPESYVDKKTREGGFVQEDIADYDQRNWLYHCLNNGVQVLWMLSTNYQNLKNWMKKCPKAQHKWIGPREILPRVTGEPGVFH